jgi:hypothetical protein
MSAIGPKRTSLVAPHMSAIGVTTDIGWLWGAAARYRSTSLERSECACGFKRSRCLIPASGYYEWLNTPTGKQPYYYTARDGSPLTIAGLWDEWKDIETGEPLKSCTMIVTDANDLAAKVHDRMPVLLQPKDFDRWLAGTAGTELLRPAPNDYLQAWPVSNRVNSSCRFFGSSEETGKPIAIVDRAHAKLPVKCAAKPPFVSKTAFHGDLLEA